MSTLAEIAADTAAWLDDHAHPELARIVNIQLMQDPAIGASVSLQLDSKDPVNGLASWSDRLGLPVTLRSTNRYLDARIATRTDSGNSVELWNHLAVQDWVTLQLATGKQFTEPIELDSAMLRAAIGTSTAAEVA